MKTFGLKNLSVIIPSAGNQMTGKFLQEIKCKKPLV
jgi:hypothetical protein